MTCIINTPYIAPYIITPQNPIPIIDTPKGFHMNPEILGVARFQQPPAALTTGRDRRGAASPVLPVLPGVHLRWAFRAFLGVSLGNLIL